MKILDKESLFNGMEDTTLSIDTIQDQISGVQKAISNFTSLDEELKGQGGSAIRSFYNDCHQPFLIFLHQSLTNYQDTLYSMRDAVNSFESSSSGYISQDYLENEVIDGLENVENQSIEMTQDANAIIKDIQDLVSIETIDESEVIDTVRRGKSITNEIVEDLNLLDNSQVLALEAVKSDLNNMRNFLSSIESKFANGSISITNFNVDSIKDIKEYDAIKNGPTGQTSSTSTEKIDREFTETLTDLDEESQEFLIQAHEDLENDEIDINTYESIRSGLVETGAMFVHNLIQSKVTNEMIDSAVTGAVGWAQHNTELFMNRGLVTAPVYGNVTSIPEPPNALKNIARGAARGGVPVIGAAVDFGIQIYNGEDATDAAIKTGGHLAAGVAGAAIGTAIPVPILGTAIGFAVGVAGSMAFDAIYDNREIIADKAREIGKSAVDLGKSAVDSITNTAGAVGDAITGAFSSLGSIFG